ncbi:hypothetical protein H4R24_004725 [Coemansia sp. RSA 988]|nr:hypothetical protein H4R24_004725 [Coemansia sp. RSA 988]
MQLLVHNVDSLQRNIVIIITDEAYTNSNILLLVETQAFAETADVVPGFVLAAYNFLTVLARGSGAACFARSKIEGSITPRISQNALTIHGRISVAGVNYKIK